MRLRRVHVEAALGAGARVALAGSAAEHVARVLRLREGDAITLFNGDGADYPSVIRRLRRGAVEAEVQGVTPARAESPLAITLVQGIARGERMDFVVQKATELGAAAIRPVATARSVVKLDARSRAAKLAHWRRIAISACEQCGRARLPEVAAPVPLAEWLRAPAPAGRRLLLSPEGGPSLADAAAGVEAALLLVGPEGGLEDAERDAAAQSGYLSCRLGPRVLRSETASLAALAVLQSVAGDLR